MEPRYDVNDIGKFFDLDIVIKILERYNKNLADYERVRYERNKISEEIGKKAIAGEDTTELRRIAGILKEDYKMLEEDVEDEKRYLLKNVFWLAEVWPKRREVKKINNESQEVFNFIDDEEILCELKGYHYETERYYTPNDYIIAEEELKYVRKLVKEKEENYGNYIR